MPFAQTHRRVLLPYFVLTYLLLLVNAFTFLQQIRYTGLITVLFSVDAYLTYCFIYVGPVFLLLLLLRRVLTSSGLTPFFRKLHIAPTWLVYGLAVLVSTLIQVLIFADGFVFRLFSFHLNGFVWNLVTTKGGIASMGGDTATVLSFAGIVAGFLLIQTMMLILVLAAKRFQRVCESLFTRRRVALVGVAMLILGVSQGIAFGLSHIRSYSPILSASKVFPLYQPITFKRIARSLGLKTKLDPSFKMKVESFNLRYPLKPIERLNEHKHYNIVWLVAESLRFDMVDPVIMPQTWTFAQRSLWFQDHYSGGNGTRMGMFAMFYGLYGNYWFSFLDETRGPVLFDVLLQDHYQMKMFTSANFSYPEFDKTIFARIPRDSLHEETEAGIGWQRDRQNVTLLLDFIEHREPDRPFMTFLFFESPHARYHFPPENAIRVPYLEELNYATMNVKRDIGLIKNRYMNSCNHLDGQLARILKYLEQNHLLDSTIVLITGDHGEEFMEKGHWGHGSSFVEEQIRAPLVLWIPGQPPTRITRITSHLDIPATLLPLLGVANPPQDYSLGFDLLGGASRDFTILSDWNALVYLDQEYKATFPMKVARLAQDKVTTTNDAPVPDGSVFYQSRHTRLVEVMKELARFGI